MGTNECRYSRAECAPCRPLRNPYSPSDRMPPRVLHTMRLTSLASANEYACLTIVLDVAQHVSARKASGIQRRLRILASACGGEYESPRQPPITSDTAAYCVAPNSSPRKIRANTTVSAGYAADSVPTMVIGPAMIDSKYRIQPVPSMTYARTPSSRKARPSTEVSDGCAW